MTHLVGRIKALAVDRESVGAPGVRVGDVLRAAGSRTFGPLLLIVGLFSISPATIVPGMTWASAAVALLLAIQMALGASHPWLPRKVLDACMKPATVRKASETVEPWANKIDRFLKPRLTMLTERPFLNIAGLMVAAAALVTFPLGFIPVAPVAPGAAITLIGLGLFVRDGLLLLFGGTVVAGSIALAVLAVP